MANELRRTVDALTLRHLYALVVGAVLAGAGWYLSWEITSCMESSLGGERVCRPAYGARYRIYAHRPYGVALIVLAAVFIALVIRDARRNAPHA